MSAKSQINARNSHLWARLRRIKGFGKNRKNFLLLLILLFLRWRSGVLDVVRKFMNWDRLLFCVTRVRIDSICVIRRKKLRRHILQKRLLWMAFTTIKYQDAVIIRRLRRSDSLAFGRKFLRRRMKTLPWTICRLYSRTLLLEYLLLVCFTTMETWSQLLRLSISVRGIRTVMWILRRSKATKDGQPYHTPLP